MIWPSKHGDLQKCRKWWKDKLPKIENTDDTKMPKIENTDYTKMPKIENTDYSKVPKIVFYPVLGELFLKNIINTINYNYLL